jgi:2-haloacid dehalogenase
VVVKIHPAMMTLLAGLAFTVIAAPRPEAHREAVRAGRFKAVVFDYLVLFNPDSVTSEVERVFPGKGKELTNRWRTRQFEYSWLRSITHQYVDFLAITEDALVYAVDTMNLPLTPNDRRRLLDAYMHLEPWPDTMAALSKLKASGISIVTLANFSPTMLRLNAENAGLTRFFDLLLSTDLNRTYKPDPRAYGLAVDHLGLGKQDIVFAAFGGWDAAGAKAFGYPTFWVNRFGQPLEQLGNQPDGTSENLDGLLDFVLTPKSSIGVRLEMRSTCDF